MVARKPSPSSPKRSSPVRSKAGSASGPATRPARAKADGRSLAIGVEALLDRLGRDEFPPALYLDGPDEGLKAALLAELRQAWARACPEAPAARVFRTSEAGVDELLAAFHGGSLFAPCELLSFLLKKFRDLQLKLRSLSLENERLNQSLFPLPSLLGPLCRLVLRALLQRCLPYSCTW